MSTITVSPSPFAMASSETLPLGFDVSALLGVGESPSSPSATLTNVKTGDSHSAGLSGSPLVSGSTIVQTVTALVAGQRYRLAISFTAAAGKVWTVELLIDCLF